MELIEENDAGQRVVNGGQFVHLDLRRFQFRGGFRQIYGGLEFGALQGGVEVGVVGAVSRAADQDHVGGVREGAAGRRRAAHVNRGLGRR